jgi:hypothetical protein
MIYVAREIGENAAALPSHEARQPVLS